MLTLEDLTLSKLRKLEWQSSGSIWSMKLSMSDGRQSPEFGGRNPIDKQLTFTRDNDIKYIMLLQSEDEKYINGLKFWGRDATKAIV